MKHLVAGVVTALALVTSAGAQECEAVAGEKIDLIASLYKFGQSADRPPALDRVFAVRSRDYRKFWFISGRAVTFGIGHNFIVTFAANRLDNTGLIFGTDRDTLLLFDVGDGRVTKAAFNSDRHGYTESRDCVKRSLAGVPAAGAEWRGRAWATDGDTWFFVVPDPKRPGRTRHVTVRPSGIDAPELGQPCERDGKTWWAGWDAGKWLAAYLADREVVCTGTGRRTYGRPVVDCTVTGPDGRTADLQDAIVRAGWAFDYREFSGGKYAAAEADARAARRGLHAGRCEKPWVWRRKHY